jgi:hypothetical protein
MFNQLLLIHLYRPFLKYTRTNTPLPSHVSPRKICTQAASAISKLMRMYKRTYGLKQIVNIVVYIAHTACTIHLLNLPEKNAQRDIIHGLRNLEEMADGWLCARRTLRILDISASKWQVELPPEATTIFERTHVKWGSWGSWDQVASPSTSDDSHLTHGNLQSSVTSPSRYSISPANNQVPLAAPTETIPNNPPPISMVAPSMNPAATLPAAMSAMPAARGIPSALAQRSEFPPPEPTYLRPLYQIPNLASAGPSTVPQNQPGWYDASGQLLGRQNTTHRTSPTVSGYDGTEHLVEESQDWWSHNAIGVENWSGPWTPEISTPTPALQYEGNHAYAMAMAQQPSSSSVSARQPPVTVGMPNIRPVAENTSSGYDEPWK